MHNVEEFYLLNVDLLDLQVVQNVRHRLQSHQLASTDVLLTLTDTIRHAMITTG